MKRLAYTVVAIVVAISSCSRLETAAARRLRPVAPTAANPDQRVPASPLPPTGASPVKPVLEANGVGWTSTGLEGTPSQAGTCHYRVTAGYYLPDPSCTPGAIDPRVTQSNLDRTVCRRGGYSGSVRPPESITEPAKYASMAAYSDPLPVSRTEYDHLVPLSLGGSSAIANLWAEPDQGSPGQFDPSDSFGINAKDGVEDALHQAVCAGRVTLAAGQAAIADNWTTAMARLGLR